MNRYTNEYRIFNIRGFEKEDPTFSSDSRFHVRILLKTGKWYIESCFIKQWEMIGTPFQGWKIKHTKNFSKSITMKDQ